MDHYCFSFSSHRTTPSSHVLPSSSALKSHHHHHLRLRSTPPPRLSFNSQITNFSLAPTSRRLTSSLVARAGSSHCDPSSSSSSLNTPLEPRSPSGKFLSSVFQNQRQLFHGAVADELKLLADDRDDAFSRMFLSSGTDEAFLHRRIAELKEDECQTAIEDVMYMLILYRFSEIRVPLVPKLSKCVYNGRLEIWPAKNWELESFYSLEVLEMIKEHVSMVIGLRANSSIADNWATTEIQRLHLSRLYAASILYGYFLKSASLRHQLERCLVVAPQDLQIAHRSTLQLPASASLTNLVFGRIGNIQSCSDTGSNRQECKRVSLRCYILGFKAETLQSCAKPKSKEAENLIKKHSCALFGDENSSLLDNDEVILTSFSSLKRLVLEAVAFGSFLWDTEEYVNSLFKLKEN